MRAENNYQRHLERLGEIATGLRCRKGLSQEALAEAIGISRFQLSRHENGKIDMPLHRFLRMCLVLDESPAEVLSLLY